MGRYISGFPHGCYDRSTITTRNFIKNKITFPFAFQWNLPVHLVTSFKLYRAYEEIVN